MVLVPTVLTTLETTVKGFFQQSEGGWYSQRRYYKLHQETEPQEVVSQIQVVYLEQGSSQLVELAQRHELTEENVFVCGSRVTWESSYTNNTRKPSKGSTVFGVKGSVLYRDRGFATPKPVTAIYHFPNPHTMNLKTEYNGSAFEEEIKLVGKSYRTRQTIISRAGEEIMIGQYLEQRC